MPGLLRGMVRTAAVVGTASATRGAVERHQAKKNVAAYSRAEQEVYAQQPQAEPVYAAPPPPPVAPASEEDIISQLERLGALKAQGILTEEEFEAQKAKLLNS